MNSKTLWRLGACALFLLGLYNAWLLVIAAPHPTWGDLLLASALSLFSMIGELIAYQCLRYHRAYTGNQQLKMVAVGTLFLTLSIVHALVCSFTPALPLSMVRFMVSFLPILLPLAPFKKNLIHPIR